MARTVVSTITHYSSAMAKGMRAWSGEPKKKSEPKKKKASMWNRSLVRDELNEFVKTADWSRAFPKHFVELYAALHTEVYEVTPLDLETKGACMAAASLAKRALLKFFGGDGNELARFMQWVWLQQVRAEKRRKAGTSSSDFRVTWKYQWAPSAVTTYRRNILSTKVERVER